MTTPWYYDVCARCGIEYGSNDPIRLHQQVTACYELGIPDFKVSRNTRFRASKMLMDELYLNSPLDLLIIGWDVLITRLGLGKSKIVPEWIVTQRIICNSWEGPGSKRAHEAWYTIRRLDSNKEFNVSQVKLLKVLSR